MPCDVAQDGEPIPDCGGVLFEIEDSAIPRYRCSIGYAYGAQSLIAGKDRQVEEALSAALRALQESERLAVRLMRNLSEAHFPLTVKDLQSKAEGLRRHSEVIRELLEREPSPKAIDPTALCRGPRA